MAPCIIVGNGRYTQGLWGWLFPLLAEPLPPDTGVTFLRMTVQHFVAVTLHFYTRKHTVQFLGGLEC